MKSILTMLGLASIAFSVFWANEQLKFIQLSVVTSGEVVEQYVDTNIEGDEFYHPVIAYESNLGEQFRFRSITGSTSPAYDIGEIVQIRYNLANPNDARINSFLSIWGLSILMFFIGALLVSIGFKYKSNNAFINSIKNI